MTATARFSSFRDATYALQMSKIAISESQVRRLAHELGQELIATRDRKVIAYRRRQLPARTDVIPAAVVVEVDGGRIRTRAADAAPGVHEAQNKEDKVACLATLTSPTFAGDPQPEPPESSRCPRQVQRLVQQMKGQSGEAILPEIVEVLRELEAWQTRLGLLPLGKAPTADERRDPRLLVTEARSYLTNTQTRMDYPRYRREGLPTTSSLVDSQVGEYAT